MASIKADEGLARRYAILTSIPGIGPVVAATLVARLAELGAAVEDRSPCWPASRRSPTNRANGKERASSGEDGPPCAVPSTWRYSLPPILMPLSSPSSNASSQAESLPRPPSSPSPESSSSWRTPSSARIEPGSLMPKNVLDSNHRCSPRPSLRTRGEGEVATCAFRRSYTRAFSYG